MDGGIKPRHDELGVGKFFPHVFLGVWPGSVGGCGPGPPGGGIDENEGLP